MDHRSVTRAERRRRPLARFIEHRGEESGFVLAMCGLFLTTMMVMGGFAVDVGNWYLHALRLQRAADSASLAGAVYLPTDFDRAKATATSNLIGNDHADNFNPVITQRSDHPTYLQVKLSENVNTYFAGFVGLQSVTISRSALGEYRPYIPMGSPSNVLGVEPDPADAWQKPHDIGLQDAYWLNIAGGLNQKTNGDRYSAGGCRSAADRCDSSMPVPTGNADYTPGGQTYVVHIPSGVTGTIAVQAYDAEFAHVGDACDNANIAGDSAHPNDQTRLVAIDPSYKSGNLPFCTGDNLVDSSTSIVDTTFQMWTPVESVGGSQPISISGCIGTTFRGYSGRLLPKLDPTLPTYDSAFASAFRKWSTVCKMYVGSSGAGDYLLRVSTPASQMGINRFALRIAVMNSDGTVNVSATNALSLYSQGRLVVFAHDNAANVSFFLARLHAGAAGRMMTLTFFDIGDADRGASLVIKPPPDGRSGGSPMTQFDGCTYSPPGSSSYGSTSTGCRLSGIDSAHYNGRLVNIRVPVPSDYACNDADPEGCWVRLSLTYGAGSVQDTTSWDVRLNGAPVHLITESSGS